MRPEAALLFFLSLALASPARAQAPFAVVGADESGLDFEHFNGRSGRRYIVEIMGSGVALFDADGDGDLDALLLDGAPLPGEPPADPPRHARLFLNDGTGVFSEKPASGLEHAGVAMGAAVGDVDGDGDSDVLVTAYGPDALYLNTGAGRFEAASSEAGIADPRWTTSAAFFDMDGDSDLDLYVAGYVDFRVDRFEPCRLRGREIYCGPDRYPAISDRLYANDGSGRFEDVTDAAGIGAALGKGLGVVVGDLEGDGDPDVYVANDGTANLLFQNESAGGRVRFEEVGVFAGTAYGPTGAPEGGMGVDAGDVDGDGDLDLLVTNLDSQTNSLYRNDGELAFLETSFASGLGASTLPWVGFGARFLDADLDGDLDLLVANGHIMDNVFEIHQWGAFEQPILLFENREGRFESACEGCLGRGVGRGLALGDVDGDGDLDAVISMNDGRPLLLRGRAAGHTTAVGLELRCEPPACNRDAYGARVSWGSPTGPVREISAGGSYLSSSDPRLLLAVAPESDRVSVTIAWPGGEVERLELSVGAYHRIAQGRGVVDSTPFSPPRH